ncbi:MAG TPA: diguanylate cyclase [Kofleriaceae bacterium]|nr:diguanylate cyclase [Kofleriaceae bacterium]
MHALALEPLLQEIDQRLQDHLEWNQRLLRCAMLHETPGADLLAPDSVRRCRLGVWLEHEHQQLADFDEALIDRLEDVHRALHDAVRGMCERVLGGSAAVRGDVDRYQQLQIELVALLGHLRGRMAREQAQTDPLTGLPLRRSLARDFAARKEDAMRVGASLHVAMVDIDRFKRVNDERGHLVGDAALRHVADLLRAGLRRGDEVYRFGGEEFLVMTLSGDVEGGEHAARRLVAAVRATPMADLPLTVTIGVAEVRREDALEDAIARADAALLQGKRAGRDRVVVAGD